MPLDVKGNVWRRGLESLMPRASYSPLAARRDSLSDASPSASNTPRPRSISIFGTRTHSWRELCAADFAVFSRRLVQAERLADPLDRLRKVAAGYVDFGLQYPGQYRAMFITGNGAEPAPATQSAKRSDAQIPIPARGDQTQKESGENAKHEPDPHDFLQSAVFKALAAGIFKPEYRDVPLITQTLWAGLHGVVSLHQTRARHPTVTWRPIQALTEMMIECLVNGMIVPALAATPAWRRSE